MFAAELDNCEISDLPFDLSCPCPISSLNMIDVITPVTIDAVIRVKSNVYLQLYNEYDKYCPIPPSF
jgi:hypothetical protein